MQNAIFSRVDLNNVDCSLRNEYLDCINDLLCVDDVIELHDFHQHMKTSRFQHSINVSYYSFLIARKLNADAYSIARAGLLHDLYLYDRHFEQPIEGRHCSVHPRIALENAKKATKTNAIIDDAILHHMWPMTIHTPKTKEGWILQAVDKYCCLSEVLLQGSRKVRYSHTSVSFLSMLALIVK
ncbi:MAG: HD domain-containing protein [Longicatena sp.]